MPRTTVSSQAWTLPEPWVQSESMALNDELKRRFANMNIDWTIPVAEWTPEQQRAYQNVANAQGRWDWLSNYTNAILPEIQNYAPREIEFRNPFEFRGYDPYQRFKGDIESLYSKYSLLTLDDIFKAMGPVPDKSAIDLSAALNFLTGYGTDVSIAAERVNRGDIRDVSAGKVDEELKRVIENIDPTYFSAVQEQVANEIRRNALIEQQRNASAAAQAGAFGGGRHGVVEAETNRAMLDKVAQSAATLQLQKLEFARQLAESNLARDLQAALANQGVDLNVATENARLGTQANIAAGQASAQLRGQLAAQAASLLAQRELAAYNAAVQAALKRGDIAADYNRVLTGRAEAEARSLNDLIRSTVESDTSLANGAANLWILKQDKDEANRRAATQMKIDALNPLSTAARTDYDIFTGYNDTLWQMGERRRQHNQNILDAERARYLMGELWPLAQLFLRARMLGEVPTGTYSFGSTVTDKDLSLLQKLGIGVDVLALLAAFSDKRLKTNIKPMGSALEKVKKLNGVEWTWKTSGKRSAGLLAQDVERVQPDAVTEIEGIKAINIPKTLGLLTEAVKELDQKIERKRRAK